MALKKRRTENFIILLVSLACIGLTIESIIMAWEFWVPPIIIIGTIFLWVFNLSEKPDYEIRKVYYLVYAMFTIFFHGVHKTSFFDVATIFSLAMVAFALFGHIYMINLFMAEYLVVMAIQIALALGGDRSEFSALGISRLILHVCVIVLVYFCCIKTIHDNNDLLEEDMKKNDRIESYDADMEDFLSNISHELRTPVNVVSGMSDLLIKKNAGPEAYNIKEAGIRLAYQIEDILHYTECKRNKVLLEEEPYMSVSLINDVVTSFRMLDNSNKLELVVDLAPSVPVRLFGDIRKLHKIFSHLLENAVKFTKRGGIYVNMFTEDTDYGVNLCIEVTDTGIGMDQKDIEALSEGMYQVNKKRNRSSGGIGLGLYIVYGFTHKMGGFVKIISEKKSGTTIRVTIPQKVVDATPCLSLSDEFSGDVLFHVRSDKYKVPKIRDFYRVMATRIATEIHVQLYSAETVREIESLSKKLNVSHIFMGQEEYEANSWYFDLLSQGDTVVAVACNADFEPKHKSNVIVMPKPLYAYPIIKVLNEGKNAGNMDFKEDGQKLEFDGVRALIVDDEPMNLVVASGLFSDYNMIIDTASSGREAIEKYKNGDFDLVFMDHMMPEMDGVEAMKQIKSAASDLDRSIIVVALTANAVSGAREMFMNEGFDGFIAKPIDRGDFERVMQKLLPGSQVDRGGENA